MTVGVGSTTALGIAAVYAFWFAKIIRRSVVARRNARELALSCGFADGTPGGDGIWVWRRNIADASVCLSWENQWARQTIAGTGAPWAIVFELPIIEFGRLFGRYGDPAGSVRLEVTPRVSTPDRQTLELLTEFARRGGERTVSSVVFQLERLGSLVQQRDLVEWVVSSLESLESSPARATHGGEADL